MVEQLTPVSDLTSDTFGRQPFEERLTSNDIIQLRNILSKSNNLPPPVASLQDFYQLVYNCFTEKLKHEDGSQSVVLSRSFPLLSQEIFHEIVAYTLKGRIHAKFGQQGAMDGKNQTRSPVRPSPIMVAQDLPDPAQPGQLINVYDWRFENVIEITSWAQTPEEAEYRSLWLESMFRDYRDYFQRNGCGLIILQQRTEDIERTIQPGDVRHFGCPLLYKVMTAQRTYARIKSLQEVQAGLGID